MIKQKIETNENETLPLDAEFDTIADLPSKRSQLSATF